MSGSGIAGWGALAGGLAQGAVGAYEGIQGARYGRYRGSEEVKADIEGHKLAGNELEKLFAANPDNKDLQMLVAVHRAYNGGAVPKVTAAGAGPNPSAPTTPATAASPAGQAQSPAPGGASTAPGNTDQMYP